MPRPFTIPLGGYVHCIYSPNRKEMILQTLDGILRTIVATIEYWYGFRFPKHQKGHSLGPISRCRILPARKRAGWMRWNTSNCRIVLYQCRSRTLDNESIKEYSWIMLLKGFDSSPSDPCIINPMCACCDVCGVKCTCISCR